MSAQLTRATLRLMRRWLSVFGLALVLSDFRLDASKPKLAWEHGTLADMSAGTALSKKKHQRFVKRKYTWDFKIDDGSEIINAQYRGPKALVVDKGTIVSFAVAGDALYMRDSGGQPHKLEVMRKLAK